MHPSGVAEARATSKAGTSSEAGAAERRSRLLSSLLSDLALSGEPQRRFGAVRASNQPAAILCGIVDEAPVLVVILVVEAMNRLLRAQAGDAQNSASAKGASCACCGSAEGSESGGTAARGRGSGGLNIAAGRGSGVSSRRGSRSRGCRSGVRCISCCICGFSWRGHGARSGRSIRGRLPKRGLPESG